MAGRRLDPDELALWRKVAESVRPLGRRALPPETATANLPPTIRARTRTLPSANDASAPRKSAPPLTDTLDGGWDRRLRRGIVQPDAVIDLHGHTLATAHAALDHALERAVMAGQRILLVITGRPPRPGQEPRGLIRAAIGDWLAAGPHAGRIAAVRNAHPRHGGAGALYVVLRRRRESTARIC